MIESRKYVPNYYEKSRDFQVFLKLLDLIVNACKGDIDYFTSLISPKHCKARMLPLLSSYVGYEYDYEEKVAMNRVITENWADLKRNRGSLTGARMAVALAMSQLPDLDSADVFKLFNVTYDDSEDEKGQKYDRFNVYLYHTAYLSKLYDLIEAIRPAGTLVNLVPSIPIESSDTIVLTDEYRILGYDYCTGKLIRIGDIPIYIENSWEIMQNGQTTGVFLVDGRLYDTYHNDLGMYIDSQQHILRDDGTDTEEVIRAPKIYKLINSELTYTGKYFNLEHSARVLNTCYEIRCGGKSTGYFIDADSWRIVDNTKSRVQFYLKDYMLNGVIVKKLFSISEDTKYNWHIDMSSGYFVKDNDGLDVDKIADTVPWDEYTYITKKRYVMNTNSAGVMYITDYFVNAYEDIQDNAGNIILSKKDRYKVSDSTSIGFSEVHDLAMHTTYDKTWINARSRTYNDDRDYFTQYKETDYNDYTTGSEFVDDRIQILPTDIEIDYITRPYDGSNYIGEVSVTSDAVIDKNSATIPVEYAADGETILASATIRINRTLRPQDDILSVFKLLRITYENEYVGDNKLVFVDWKIAKDAELYYSLGEMPERLAFKNSGSITRRKLTYTSTPIQVATKVYDGTIAAEQTSYIVNPEAGGEE